MFPILNPPPTFLPYHPSGSSQCTSPKHPVSCIEPRLAICFLYDIIHVSKPFSQIIPPSPSPAESKRLFYTSMSLLLSSVFPGESQGRGNLVGCRLWGGTESDTTEVTQQQQVLNLSCSTFHLISHHLTFNMFAYNL